MMSDKEIQQNKSYQGIRLIEFQVKNLFGEFDYKIPLNLESHVTAIIAPNGTGKTLCLRMINSLFEQKWSIFSDINFQSITYKFNDNTVIELQKSNDEEGNDDGTIEASFSIAIQPGDGSEGEKWTPRFSEPGRLLPLERYVPFLTRVGNSKWRHDRTGEILGFTEIAEIYGDSIPRSLREKLIGKKSNILNLISAQIDCRLIETQRLLVLKNEAEEPYYGTNRRPRSTLAIAQKARTLKEIISNEINAYATLSQSLDRSFPKRVISRRTILPSDDLEAQLTDLDQKRRNLMEVGILDNEADDPVSLPEGTLEPAIAQVLSEYTDDTRKKLDSLSQLLAKINLFRELINQRFVTKDVRISRKNGIDVIFKDNQISLEKLSSGEQHQLVLFFELLFEIRPNSLILIDEPELSLHVAWQKKFISDLIKIIELNKFDVLLATHSPQLIGRWNDLVVELGDVYEGEDIDGFNGI